MSMEAPRKKKETRERGSLRGAIQNTLRASAVAGAVFSAAPLSAESTGTHTIAAERAHEETILKEYRAAPSIEAAKRLLFGDLAATVSATGIANNAAYETGTLYAQENGPALAGLSEHAIADIAIDVLSENTDRSRRSRMILSIRDTYI